MQPLLWPVREQLSGIVQGGLSGLTFPLACTIAKRITTGMSGDFKDGKFPEQTLTQFCRDLSDPLEVLTNLVYLAMHADPATNDFRQHLRMADNVLGDIRAKVLAHRVGESESEGAF